MPKISLDKSRVLKLVGKKVSDETLLNEIPFMGTDLEGVTKDKIEVEIFPDRPDLLSEEGFARYLSSFLGIKKGLRTYKVKKSDYEVVVDSSVKKIRPFTVCAVVKKLSFDRKKLDSLIDMQEKLHITHGRRRKKVAVGVYPLDKISFPVMYKALSSDKIKFKPLESNKIMSGKDILNKTDKGKEFKHLLENFSKYPVFLDSKNNFLSMPPVINSDDVGKVSLSTKDVFVECSGTDLNALSQALNIVVTSLADAGADVYEVKVSYDDKELFTPDLKTKEMKVDICWINDWLGLKLNEKEFCDAVEKCGLSYSKGKVFIPPYRVDFLHPVDVAEDVATGYKYYNFEGETVNLHTVGSENIVEVLKSKLRDTFVGLGFIENYSLNLISEDFQKKLGSKKIVRLLNSLSETHDSMREYVIYSLLLNASFNKRNVYPQRMFELGTRYVNDKDIVEKESLACLMLGDFTVTNALQVLEVLKTSFDITLNLIEKDHPLFIPGRSGLILHKKEIVGFLGELKPDLISDLEVEFPICGLELDIGCLLKNK